MESNFPFSYLTDPKVPLRLSLSLSLPLLALEIKSRPLFMLSELSTTEQRACSHFVYFECGSMLVPQSKYRGRRASGGWGIFPPSTMQVRGRGQNSSHQAWWQVPFPRKPSQQLSPPSHSLPLSLPSVPVSLF